MYPQTCSPDLGVNTNFFYCYIYLTQYTPTFYYINLSRVCLHLKDVDPQLLVKRNIKEKSLLP